MTVAAGSSRDPETVAVVMTAVVAWDDHLVPVTTIAGALEFFNGNDLICVVLVSRLPWFLEEVVVASMFSSARAIVAFHA